MISKQLFEHEFSSLAIKEAFNVVNVAGDKNLFKAEAGFNRELTEYEYYLIAVGSCLSHLISSCQELQNAVFYLASFTPSPRMKKKGITKFSHLHYNIENYLIRTQILNDRILFLVNAVYHLRIHPTEINYTDIINHSFIKNTNIEKPLKGLKKLLKKYQFIRISIVHYGSYQEEDLRTLEGFTYLLNDENNPLKYDNPILAENLPNMAKELARKIVTDKTKEYTNYNKELFNSIKNIFDVLLVKYKIITEKLST